MLLCRYHFAAHQADLSSELHRRSGHPHRDRRGGPPTDGESGAGARDLRCPRNRLDIDRHAGARPPEHSAHHPGTPRPIRRGLRNCGANASSSSLEGRRGGQRAPARIEELPRSKLLRNSVANRCNPLAFLLPEPGATGLKSQNSLYFPRLSGNRRRRAVRS